MSEKPITAYKVFVIDFRTGQKAEYPAVSAVDAAHATRQALDGYTGLLGDPAQHTLGVIAIPNSDYGASA